MWSDYSNHYSYSGWQASLASSQEFDFMPIRIKVSRVTTNYLNPLVRICPYYYHYYCYSRSNIITMAPHSSTLAWKIPWTEEPGRLQSMVAKSRTRLSDFPFIFHFHALEKEMATHSSVLGWRIPGTGEPGGLLSMGLHRVGHNWSNLAAAAYNLLREISLTISCHF